MIIFNQEGYRVYIKDFMRANVRFFMCFVDTVKDVVNIEELFDFWH